MDEPFEAGWLTRFRRGLVAGLTVLAIAIMLVSAATFVAWFAPGADSTSAGSALRVAALVTVLGNHGGGVLNGAHVSLTPVLVSGILAWIGYGQARRLNSTAGFLGFLTGYPLGVAVLADWGRLGSSYAPLGRSVLMATVFAAAVGAVGCYWDELRGRCPTRWRAVVRAAAAALAVYMLAGALLSAAALGAHLGEATVSYRQIAPGVAGLPVALIGVAATPNAVVAAMGYLAGPGFHVGALTSVSMFAVRDGRLPTFPLLAGVPSGPPMTGMGEVLALVVALVAGWCAVRTTSPTKRRLQFPPTGRPMTALCDLGLVASATGAAMVALGALAGGGIGDAALRHVGIDGWRVGLATSAAVFASGLLWIWIGWVARWLRRPGGIESRRTGTASPSDRPQTDGSVDVLSGSSRATG